MQLNIAMPTQKKTVTIAWLDINTDVGNFIIQPEHAPMIISLLPNSQVMYCLNNGKLETMNVKFGVAHITREAVTLLLSE
jgi:F0F1-type ATP synthase epsilon subunit